MKKKVSKYIKAVLSVVLITIGLLLIFNESIKQRIIDDSVKNTELVSIEQVENNKQTNTSFDFDEVQDIDWSLIIENRNSLDELPVIGWIVIPDVDISLSILNGITNQNLLAGAGTMKPDQIMGEGNYALAGHNEGAGRLLFNPLHRVEKGMLVYTTDTESIYTYMITDISMVDPDRIDVIQDMDEGILTLLTCNVDGTKRLIVQGELIELEALSTASQEKLAYFNL